MWILEDTYGAPQCGLEITKFNDFEELVTYLEDDEELYHRVLTGYADFYYQEKEDNNADL